MGPNAGVPPRFADENARESRGPSLPPPRLRASEASAAHLVCAVPFSGSWGSFPVGPELLDVFVETNPVSCFLEKQPNPRCW